MDTFVDRLCFLFATPALSVARAATTWFAHASPAPANARAMPAFAIPRCALAVVGAVALLYELIVSAAGAFVFAARTVFLRHAFAAGTGAFRAGTFFFGAAVTKVLWFCVGHVRSSGFLTISKLPSPSDKVWLGGGLLFVVRASTSLLVWRHAQTSFPWQLRSSGLRNHVR